MSLPLYKTLLMRIDALNQNRVRFSTSIYNMLLAKGVFLKYQFFDSTMKLKSYIKKYRYNRLYLKSMSIDSHYSNTLRVMYLTYLHFKKHMHSRYLLSNHMYEYSEDAYYQNSVYLSKEMADILNYQIILVSKDNSFQREKSLNQYKSFTLLALKTIEKLAIYSSKSWYEYNPKDLHVCITKSTISSNNIIKENFIYER